MNGYQPKTKRMTIKYANIQGVIGLSSGGGTTYAFNANGCFDPLQQTGGHQPYLWDQMEALYKEYKVIGAKIKFTEMRGNGSTDAGTAMYFLHIDATATEFQLPVVSSTKIGTLLEQGVIRVKDIHQFPHADGHSNNRPMQVMTRTWKLSNYKSLTKDVIAKDWWIQTTADPNGTNEPLFSFVLHQMNDVQNDTGVSTTPQRVPWTSTPKHFYMEIEYDVLFREPKIINLS